MTAPDDPEEDIPIREVVDKSHSGAPARGTLLRDRFSTDEVFQRIVFAADEEITSTRRELFFSGLAAGFAITLTFLLYVSGTASTGGAPLASLVLYPLGFIYIILGGYQLYTENTLPPVALVLERLVSVPKLLGKWLVVLAGNFTGGLLGALVLAGTGVFSASQEATAVDIALAGVQTPWGSLFFKAVFAGLIVGGVVWIDYAVQDTVSRLLIVYLAFLAIPLSDLYHVVVSFTEVVYLVVLGEIALATGLSQFVLPVLLGNTVGGVVLVTAVNYFQTTRERLEQIRFQGPDRKLSIREVLFGGLVGRSYVRVLSEEERRERKR
nr:formate/nitrite transporter family protein [Halorubellus salinus]